MLKPILFVILVTCVHLLAEGLKEDIAHFGFDEGPDRHDDPFNAKSEIVIDSVFDSIFSYPASLVMEMVNTTTSRVSRKRNTALSFSSAKDQFVNVEEVPTYIPAEVPIATPTYIPIAIPSAILTETLNASPEILEPTSPVFTAKLTDSSPASPVGLTANATDSPTEEPTSPAILTVDMTDSPTGEPTSPAILTVDMTDSPTGESNSPVVLMANVTDSPTEEPTPLPTTILTTLPSTIPTAVPTEAPTGILAVPTTSSATTSSAGLFSKKGFLYWVLAVVCLVCLCLGFGAGFFFAFKSRMYRVVRMYRVKSLKASRVVPTDSDAEVGFTNLEEEGV